MKKKFKEQWLLALKMPIIYVAVVILWALSSFLAFWEIMATRALVIRTTIRFFMEKDGLSLIMANARADVYGKVTAVIMTVVAIGIVVFGFDYHFEHAGKSQSWKFFAWTFGFQFLVLFLAYLF